MLEKIAYYFDEDLQKDPNRTAFIQVRLAPPKQKKIAARKPPKKKDGDKNLSYASCSPDIQKAFYSLLLERRLGEHALPTGTLPTTLRKMLKSSDMSVIRIDTRAPIRAGTT